MNEKQLWVWYFFYIISNLVGANVTSYFKTFNFFIIQKCINNINKQ